MIFIEWNRDEQNKIVGLKYFSSNLSGSKGVGYGSGPVQRLESNGQGLLRKSLRIARVGAIKDYARFDRATIPQRNAYLPTQPERIIYLPAPTAPATPALGQ